MPVYAIGDIQGCLEPLQRLLERIGFDPSSDRLWLTGDLVNRGPRSVEVLRFVRDLGDRVVTVLGNHDLHLLAVAAGFGSLKPTDTLRPVLDAPDGEELLQWLRHRPLFHEEPPLPFVLVHAGIPPQWDLPLTRACARELEAALRGPDHRELFRHLYGDQPDLWDHDLTGWDRLRYITNALTRMRYCAPDGRLLLEYKDAPGQAPDGHTPWFDMPARRLDSQAPTVICGHWSTLGFRRQTGILALDTGCLWGGELTAARLQESGEVQIIAVACDQALAPGPGR